MTQEIFLRAISLRDDVSVPERLAHYRPTRRSLPVVRAVIEGGATMVIAAYGSGKSLAAGIGALVVLNDPPTYKTLNPVIRRLRGVDPSLHALVRKRRVSPSCGRVAVLTGYVPDVASALARAAGLDTAPADLSGVLKRLSRCGSDQIAIVWDEFGRHLESLVAEGRARDLHALQQLAEWASRARNPRVSLVLLMHQSLLAYAGSLNQTSRNEWRKIEGRFQPIRFVEDSRELYELIADVISTRRPEVLPKSHERIRRRIAQGAISARWFDGLEDARHVMQLLSNARPLTAAALQVLPRVVARVGQNERSLFTFIEEAKLDTALGTLEVYKAFSDAMRSDVGIGGMHRRWVETENALSRVENENEREALTAACLLQLGVNGERRRLSRNTLELAVASRGGGLKAATRAVESLITRKLLIHRRPNDDVSIWYGTDVDLAGRIRDERSRREDRFDLVSFLEENHPAPFVRPMRHNAERGTARYLRGHYITTQSLLMLSEPETLLPGHGEWGHIYYVLSDSAEDIAAARARIENEWAEVDAPVVFVISNEPIPVKDAALEVAVLTALRRDDMLLGEDPLVSQEIDELLSIARRHLVLVLHRLITDRPVGTAWLHAGRQLGITPECPASITASQLMDAWYPMTPQIANDQVMRNKLSRQMQTAQVRVILRVMEHGHRAHLGYASDNTSAEASVYRTVLERTGIHYSNKDDGHFAEPTQINEPGLRTAWGLIARYFREPAIDPKPLSDIVGVLTAQPMGLPLGVIPILVMAGYRAFARAVSLRTDGTYVPDVLGFEASNMFIEPHRHTVTVYDLSDSVAVYLQEIAYVFAHKRPRPDQELIRFACDTLAHWKASLPETARRSTYLSKDALRFLRLVNEASDPATLILFDLPDSFGCSGNNDSYDAIPTIVEKVRNEVDSLIEGYVDEAVKVIGKTLAVNSGDGVLGGVQSWIKCLDVQDLLRRSDLRITDKAVLRTALDTLNGRYSPQSLARTLSSILLQQGIDQWQDTTIDQFWMLLRECRQRIEETALASDTPNRCMVPLVQARIDALEGMLRRMGEDRQRTLGQPRRLASS